MEEDPKTPPSEGEASGSGSGTVAAAPDALDSMDAKNTILMFGVVPGVIIAVLLIIGFVMYTVRKRKTERDLSDAMRLDDDGAGGMATSNINTRDMQEMGATRESSPVSDVKRK